MTEAKERLKVGDEIEVRLRGGEWVSAVVTTAGLLTFEAFVYPSTPVGCYFVAASTLPAALAAANRAEQ